MNEEELTEKLNTEKDIVEAFNNGFQKGKLEAEEKSLFFLNYISNLPNNFLINEAIKLEMKQLQKEIGGQIFRK